MSLPSHSRSVDFWRAGAAILLGVWGLMPLDASADNGAEGEASHNLPRPTGPVILTVDGEITRTNFPGEARFDMDMIESLPRHTLYTTTSVTDGMQQFDGVLMRDVMAYAGATGTIALAVALNDYQVDIPVSDFSDYEVMLATRMDGDRLKPNDKGPLWIVYPRDEFSQLMDIRYDVRWVWQLNRLTLK